jgi:hypothetical protein
VLLEQKKCYCSKTNFIGNIDGDHVEKVIYTVISEREARIGSDIAGVLQAQVTDFIIDHEIIIRFCTCTKFVFTHAWDYF